MILVALGTAFAVTLVATPLVRSVAPRLGLLDHPNTRSSHQTATPRVGGVSILLGLGAALMLLPGLGDERGDLEALFAGGLLVWVIGLADDRFGLPPWPRLAGQLLAAGVVVSATGGLERVPLPPPLDISLGGLGTLLALLWIVAVVNFYNFMDGIDGLAGVQGVITASALTLAFAREDPLVSGVAAALAGGCAAFLVYNWAPASVFLGDAGSGLLGFTVASLPLLAPPGRKSEAVVLIAASLFLFLADATSCLLRRAARGTRWFEAHREHLYQRWVAGGIGHGRVALILGFGALALTLLALPGWMTGEAVWYWASLAAGGAAITLEWLLVRRIEQQAAAART